MTLTNNLTIQGNISGSFISASKGFWTAGEYSGSSLHVKNVSGSYISASKGIYSAGHITASGNISASGNFIGANAYVTHVTASGNVSASGTIYANALQVSNLSGSFISSSKSIFTSGHISASGNISASSTGSFGALLISPNFVVGAPEASDTSKGTLLAEFKGDSESFVIRNSTHGATSTTGDYYIGNSAYQNGFVFRNGDGGLTSVFDNKLASNLTTEGFYLQKPASGDGLQAATGNVLQVEGRISGSSDLHLGHGTDGTGNIRISGSVASRNYRSFYIAAAGMTPSVTDGASTATEERPGNAGGDQSYPTTDYLAFDASTNEAANFQIAMPGEWDLGTIKARFYYMTDTHDGGSNNAIMWSIYAEAISDNESINNVFDSGFSVTSTAHNDDEKIVVSDATAAVTVQNSPAALDLIAFRVLRNGGAGGDTYTGDAHLLGVSIQYREQVIPEAAW